jgi:hypothetical protein
MAMRRVHRGTALGMRQLRTDGRRHRTGADIADVAAVVTPTVNGIGLEPLLSGEGEAVQVEDDGAPAQVSVTLPAKPAPGTSCKL